MTGLPSDRADILRGLIAAQAECMDLARAGKGTGRSAYWARNHPRISPLLAQAQVLLPQDERRALYATLLRMGLFPQIKAGDLPLLLAGYRDILPDFAPGQGMGAARLHMLQVFGFDDRGEVPGGPPTDLAMLKARSKPVDQALRFSNLPGQRAKAAGFAALADQAPRILSVLRHAGYRHDHRTGHEATYDDTNLLFWGFVLVALMAEATRDPVIADMVGPDHDIPRRALHEHILHATLTALKIAAGSDAATLAARCEARLGASAAARWAARLGLPLAGHDWEVLVAIPAAGNPGSGHLMPNLRLTVRPDPVSSWRIVVMGGKAQIFADREGRSGAAGGAIPTLAALEDFPRWLAALGRDHGHPHDPARAEISCGRQAAARRAIRDWLLAD